MVLLREETQKKNGVHNNNIKMENGVVYCLSLLRTQHSRYDDILQYDRCETKRFLFFFRCNL